MSRYHRPKRREDPRARILVCHAIAALFVLAMSSLEKGISLAQQERLNYCRFENSRSLELPFEIKLADEAEQACSAQFPRLYCLNEDHLYHSSFWSHWATRTEETTETHRLD